MLPHPTVVVPGITASTLRDLYPLPPEPVWTLLRKRFERLALHPDDLRYEGRQPARVESDQLFEVAYEELIEDLRAELSDKARHEVPVYRFDYDWRQPLEATQQQLAAFIREVAARTRLMPHYFKAFGEHVKVNLLGHSMGGLVIARCLSDQPPGLPVEKVVTLATPFRGSVEAVVKLAIGTGNLGRGKPTHSERRAARVTPALYQLLPAFSSGIRVDPGLPTHLFDPGLWQRSVVDSLAKYVREVGLPGGPPRQRAADLLAELLHLARESFRRIETLDLTRHGLEPRDWLAIAGVDSDTRVQLAVKRDRRSVRFEFDHRKDVMNRWSADEASDRRRTGDGTVPFEGAVPPFLGEERLVLVVPDDYGFWEVADKAMSALGGFHGLLPNMNLVQRIVMRFVTGGADRYGNTWGRRAPGSASWNPPLALEERP